jgi:signal transduction histidine kinase
LETAVFRIVQEALNNVFRHSGARSTWVALRQQDGQLIVTVRDNGKGISASVLECRPDSIGVGIGGMRQRVKEFGGDLRLENCNPGALVEVTIPTGSRVQEVNAAPATDTARAEPAIPSAQPISAQLPAPVAASKASVIPASISPAFRN